MALKGQHVSQRSHEQKVTKKKVTKWNNLHCGWTDGDQFQLTTVGKHVTTYCIV